MRYSWAAINPSNHIPSQHEIASETILDFCKLATAEKEACLIVKHGCIRDGFDPYLSPPNSSINRGSLPQI